MAKPAAILILVLFAFATAFVSIPQRQCYEYSAKNLRNEQVIKDIKKGWLPNWLPAASENIRYAYEQESNLVIIRLNVPLGEQSAILEQAKSASKDVIILGGVCNAKWWEPNDIQKAIKMGSMTVFERADDRSRGAWYIACNGTEIFMWFNPQGSLINY